MKIFDCFMYFDEDVVLDVRLNFLDKFVDKFVIIESEYNHKGEKRIPLFNINKFKKFKDKIKYILTNDIPPGIEKINKEDVKMHLIVNLFLMHGKERTFKEIKFKGD